jgi:hypothetical protein
VRIPYLIVVAPAFALALALAAGEGAKWELPAGPASDTASKIAADTKPAVLPKLADDPWQSPATWRRFAELLSAESAGKAPDPARRAELALLALAQHRWDDAWLRFSECASSPSTVAALLPRFLPGTVAALNEALPDGAVLAPALPPLAAEGPGAPRGFVQRRAMRIEGLVLGTAHLALRVSVEGEGVEIDIEHKSGGAVKLKVAIPEDPQFAFADEYVDWFRQEKPGVPHEVSIQPGDEAHTLYARFEPRKAEWPTLLPDRMPAQIEQGILWLEPGSDERVRPLLEAVAECLTSGPLHVVARLGGPRDASADHVGVRVDLSDGTERSRKLTWIAGAVERCALGRAR